MEIKKKIQKYRLALVSFVVFLALYFVLKFSVSFLVVSLIRDFVNDDYKNKITLNNVSFEPFLFRIKIQNIEFDDTTSLENLLIDISLPDFLNKTLIISNIDIISLKSAINIKNNQLVIGNLNYKYNSENDGAKEAKWNVIIKKSMIKDSHISINQKHHISLHNVEMDNFDLFNKKANISALLDIDDSHLDLKGSVSQHKVLINYELDKFNLDFLNQFFDKNDNSLGKIKGRLSTLGVIDIADNKVKVKSNLELKNLIIYSKDLKYINYFCDKLNVEKFEILDDKKDLEINGSELLVRNLLFSIPAKIFSNIKLSDFSKIKISNIKFHSTKNNSNKKALLRFSQGGFLAFNQYNKILDIKARGVDLVQFSKSFESSLNYQISSGKLSLDSRSKVEKEKIKAKIKVNLAQFSLDNKNEFGQKIENQSLIPLKTAVSMVKDDDGNIDLAFNLYGSKDDPDFDLSNIIFRGLGSVVISKLSSEIASKLAVKFSPMLISSLPVSPGNIFTFANGVYKFATKVRFQEINFVEKDSKIKDSSYEGLAKIVKFLQQNKKVKINICPQASIFEYDQDPMAEVKALSLANERIEVLQDFFKNGRDSSGVIDQVIFCRPTILDNKEFANAKISI